MAGSDSRWHSIEMESKTMNKLSWNKRPLALVLAVAIASPALAQSAPETELRLRKVEAEVAALQRVVFPGGDGRFFPQMQPGSATGNAPGSPASAPTADLLARMDALEGQVARLTAQVEEDHNRIEKLEARLVLLETSKIEAAAPSAIEGNTAAMTGAALAAPTPEPKPAPAPAPAPAASKPAPAKPAVAANPSAKRVAAVRAIEKPKTDDPGDDEYSYGYRLWEAKFYPEAQQQLKLFLQKYPKHPRTSWARNLLGRAYLDDKNAHEAAGWFLQNYKTEPKGDRAPDSLLFLAESMRQLDDTKRGCVALKQFAADYPKEAAGRLKAQYDTTASGLKCN
jgi:TolA-binding protein